MYTEGLGFEDYFIKEKDDINMYNSYLSKVRCKFITPKHENRLVSGNEVLNSACYSLVINEITSFYNNDICISFSLYYTMSSKKEVYHKKVIGYYMDNVAVKVVSCWDYLFQLLSKYLNIDLLGDCRTKDRIIVMNSKELQFVKDNGKTRIVYKDYPPDILKEKIDKMINEKKVLVIDKRNKALKRSLKRKGLSINSRTEKLLKLYAMNEVSVLKEQVRNEIIHKRSLSFNYSISSADILPIEGISCNPVSWFEYNDFRIIIEKNLVILRDAIQTMIDIVELADTPNSISNANIKYIVMKAYCSKCDRSEYIAEKIFNDFQNAGFSYICHVCNSDMDVRGNFQVNERDYVSTLIANIKNQCTTPLTPSPSTPPGSSRTSS